MSAEGTVTERLIPGVLVRVRDPRAQAYLQSFAFATGPDRALNELAFDEVRRGLELRRPQLEVQVNRVVSSQLLPSSAELSRARAIAASVGISDPRTAVAADDYGWKIHAVPRTARHVVSVGCGDGMELVFLRAALPEARIEAFDWTNKLLPGLAEATECTFRQTNLVHSLADIVGSADVVFSNHVLEHMYDPEGMLRSLAQCLRPGGTMISALPMEGTADAPYAARLRELARAPKRLHPVDLVWVNPGHAWKTNAGDLQATVLGNGFTTCELLQRADHLSRSMSLDRKHFERRRNLIAGISAASFGLANEAIRRAHRTPSPRVMKLWFAIDSRSRFGINRLKRDFAEEVLVVAQKA